MMLSNTEKLIVISTEKEILDLIAYLQDKDYIAYDTETTGLALDAEVVGFSVAAEVDTGYYVIVKRWNPETKQLIDEPNREAILKLLNFLLTKNLVMHNGIVDVNWTHKNFGIFLMPALHTDTMILSHLLDENLESHGLKELGFHEFGETAKQEFIEMRESVIANGGIWQLKRGGEKEMYKADPMILGKYGAKDTVLTIRLFYIFIPRLFEKNLQNYFFQQSMPLFRGPTYQLNTVGIRVDVDYLNKLELELTEETNTLRAQILADIQPYIKDDYPGTTKKNTFNIDSTQQIGWLLFVRLKAEWNILTPKGKQIAKEIMGKIPYSIGDKKRLERELETYKDIKGKSTKIFKIVSADKKTLKSVAKQYAWADNILKLRKAEKLLSTYVHGIKSKLRYGILHPSFLQIGTVGTRYSSKNPNSQNWPRDDKRIKRIFISRPGHVFVGGDQDQLEVRVFCSFAQDQRLLDAFAQGYDPYSIVGMEIYNKTDCSPFKEGKSDAFGVKYPKERQASKGTLLASAYGTTKFRLADTLDKTPNECQDIIDRIFEQFPSVKQMQSNFHKTAIETGVVHTLLGRPRHIPEAKKFQAYGDFNHSDLSYNDRTILNSAVNSPIQGTAGDILNASAILFLQKIEENHLHAKILLQVHDELIVECPETEAQQVKEILQYSMENAVQLPGVKLKCTPKIAKTIADLK